MKKLLLVSAVAALSVTSVYAETGVYGKVGADLRYADDGDVTLDNNGSRLGVKGSTPITANTNAIYQAELGLSIDGNTGADITVRDTYLGLQNNAVGTLKAGKLTTIDDAVNFTNPSDYWNSGYLASFDAPRVNNALAYVSPNFSGFQALAMYQVDSAGKGGEYKTQADDAGTYGVGGKYENDMFKVGASFIDQKDVLTATRVSGAVKVVPQVELSAGYQVTDIEGKKEDENSYIVAAKYDVPNSPWSAYVEYDGVESAGGTKDADGSIVSLGGNYDFNKAVEGRIYAGFEDPKGGDDSYGIGAGMTYKF